ncbi:UNVERIFIED_CONTAM: hypothetical protein BJ099_10682 [Lysinibacillus xylanilyticus]
MTGVILWCIELAMIWLKKALTINQGFIILNFLI